MREICRKLPLRFEFYHKDIPELVYTANQTCLDMMKSFLNKDDDDNYILVVMWFEDGDDLPHGTIYTLKEAIECFENKTWVISEVLEK